MTLQDVDQSIPSRHPCLPFAYSYRLLQTHSCSPLLPGTLPGLAIRSERLRPKIWGNPAPLLPFCTINSSVHCFGSSPVCNLPIIIAVKVESRQ